MKEIFFAFIFTVMLVMLDKVATDSLTHSLAHSLRLTYSLIYLLTYSAASVGICASRESYSLNAHYLVVEYPSYGISNGLPSEELYDEVAFSVYKFVVNELKVPPSRIVLIGRSIGTGYSLTHSLTHSLTDCLYLLAHSHTLLLTRCFLI